jgi:hypothetical protein
MRPNKLELILEPDDIVTMLELQKRLARIRGRNGGLLTVMEMSNIDAVLLSCGNTIKALFDSHSMEEINGMLLKAEGFRRFRQGCRWKIDEEKCGPTRLPCRHLFCAPYQQYGNCRCPRQGCVESGRCSRNPGTCVFMD